MVERLTREAQAIAALSHPNIVAVYDVGRSPQGLFIAMERVHGQTLRQWLHARRSAGDTAWPPIVDVFIDAAEGLAAAHARGLIHRDFKPDNAMVTVEGTTKVLDFGLARAFDTSDGKESDTVASRDDEERGADLLASPLTATGIVLGTPAYMAPEQHTGSALGPATDQFALCTALFEALYGVRPFKGTHSKDLLQAKQQGAVLAAPSDSKVPRWLDAVVRRGLQAEPERRWSSMRALINALRFGGRRRRTRIAIALLGVALTGGVFASVAAPPEGPCEARNAGAAAVFDLARQHRLLSGFERIAGEDGRKAWVDVEATLQAYLSRWEAQHREVCRSAGARLDVRMRCLQSDLDRVSATLDVLAEPDAEVIRNARRAALRVAGHTPACEVASNPMYEGANAQTVRRIDSVLLTLARAAALDNAGKSQAAAATAVEAVDRATAIGVPRLEGLARMRLGLLRVARGDVLAGERDLSQAYFIASEAHDALTALAASAELTQLRAEGNDLEGSRSWLRHAEVELQRAAGDGESRAQLLMARATLRRAEGRIDDAIADAEEAVAIRSTALGESDPFTLSSRHNAGVYLALAGRFDAAAKHMEFTLQAWDSMLGPIHPDLVAPLSGYGTVLAETGQHERAVQLHRRALAIAETTWDADSVNMADVLTNLGIAEDYVGQHEEAQRHLQRARTIYEATYGTGDLRSARVGVNLGMTLHHAGQHDAALDEYRRAHATLAGADDGAGLPLRITEINIANELRELDRLDEAIATSAATIASMESGGDPPGYIAVAQSVLGQSLQAAGRDADAVIELERALSVAPGPWSDPESRAETQWALARSLTRLDSQRERAVALARAAREDYAALPSGQATATQIDAWLAERGP